MKKNIYIKTFIYIYIYYIYIYIYIYTEKQQQQQHRKARRKIDYSQQKVNWQHEDQQNNNNQKTKMGRKKLSWRFNQLISYILLEKTWTWLRKGNFERETKSIPIAAQNNDIRTIYFKTRIDKTKQNGKCRLCGKRYETINHIIKYSKLAQKDY